MIKLYYWNKKENAGDYFSYWLAKKLFKNVEYSDNCPSLITSGSILDHACLTNNTIVWGSGWHNTKWSPSCQVTNKDNFKAVRGKLTANYLKLDLEKVALGDPGLLASKYFKYNRKEITKKHKILILSHWRDFKELSQKYGDKYSVVSMETNNIEQIFTNICESELVLSSSLHGIIFAHSFGVPAVHFESTPLESLDNFKFKDYYSVLDIPYTKITTKDSTSATFEDLYKRKREFKPSLKRVHDIQKQLLAVLPKEKDFPDKFACVCAIAKNENNYLAEWVKHHKKLGFDNIILFDNNDLDGEHFEDVIKDEIKSGFVKVFNVRGKANQQIECYNTFYHSDLAKHYQWIGYFDIDEFLYLDSPTVFEWLSNKKYNRFDGIAVNWRYFDDNNLVKVENNNYSITRFTSAPIEEDWNFAQHRFSKRFIRTSIKNITINSSHGPIAKAQMNEYATGIENKLALCNIEGKPLAYNGIVFSNWSHTGGYLAHYRYKTIEEYVNNKMKRGYPTLYKNSGKDLTIFEFFRFNTVTEEKIKFIAEVTGDTIENVRRLCNEVKHAPTAKKVFSDNKPKKKTEPKKEYYLYF